MKIQKRHHQILVHLSEHSYLSVEEAVHLCGASPATIRRDFATLTRGGCVERSRGGVKPVPHKANDALPFGLREIQYTAAKEALAKRAAALLAPGDVIIVDGNPLEEIQMISRDHVRVVIKDGTVYKNTLGAADRR